MYIQIGIIVFINNYRYWEEKNEKISVSWYVI